jgi:purine-binding chemotaxis protein CheW
MDFNEEQMKLVDPQFQQQDEEGNIRNIQIIVFKLGGEEYALHIDQIKEVVLTPKIAKIPLTPKYIKGVSNIRGNILAIVDLEIKFGLVDENNELDSEKAHYSLVVESKDYNMAVLVKEVPNTLAIAEKEINYSPSIINDTTGNKEYIRGIIKTGDRLIIMIDVFKIFSKEDIDSAILSS